MKVHHFSLKSGFTKLKPALKVFLFLIICSIPATAWSQAAASWNYDTRTGTLGTTYSWIDCSSGTSIISGDDVQASINWPFNFIFYDNSYTIANSISVATNGFIRLDGSANTNYNEASSYNMTSSATNLGQIIATSVYDGYVGRTAGSWCRYLVTGTAPDRILTIEFNNIEIDYNDGLYANAEVSFYETVNKIILKLGNDNITVSGVDMGIHSGVDGFYNKWQEVENGINNTWIEYTSPASLPVASWNYSTQTGTLGTTYNWIDCSSGTGIIAGDDVQSSINWPFNFTFYENSYTTTNNLSVASNGFIRLDGIANTDYSIASSYDLIGTATNLGQIIATSVYDGYVGRTTGSWCRYLVTGTAPDRILTIEYNNIEIDYNDRRYANVEVSFYETVNEIVLKLGSENLRVSGVDMGIHSGVDGFFNKWQEVQSGTNNTWIRYMLLIEVVATSGILHANYPDLKAAIDAINDGTHKGNITIKIHGSTIETSPVILNASGSGNANYSSVNIYPTSTGLSVSGNLSAPLIDLNGADNVTLDGRVNATGTTKDLTIVNSSTSGLAGTSTIRLINNATNNIVKYCNIKGSETTVSGGILFFSTATVTNGNGNNTIDNNNITNSANADRPVNAIFSSGTAGRENNGNSISNNSIYNFLRTNATSNGIFLSSYNNAWNITGNSFYETTSFAPSSSAIYNIIQINNTSGNSFIISGNYLGGSTVLCGGTAWTKTNANNNIFNAIYLNVGSTEASSIQNNTIQNFSWSNSSNATWTGINVLAGNVNMGTDAGNSIGDTTGTGSITVSSGTNGETVYGININSTGTVDCQNNLIGSITAVNTNTSSSSNIYGIHKSATAGTTTIRNNTIGSATTSNSIYASSISTGNPQTVSGISSYGIGTTTISANVIANMTNSVTGTSTSKTTGIETTAGSNTILNNNLYNLSSASSQTGSGVSASAIGIIQNSSTAGTIQSVSGNTVNNISNTHPTARVDLYGIYYSGPTSGANTVSGNFIHSISLSSSNILSAIDGIYLNNGLTTVANNIVTLGNSITAGYLINGIWDNSGATNNNSLYFNTVYIGGTVTGTTSSTSALWNAANTSTRNYRNNIFFNARSGGSTGKHYAIRLAGTTGLTIDYNDYFVSGTGGILGYLTSDRTTLALWQVATGQDVNSLNIDPAFTNAGGTSFEDYHISVLLPGVSGTGITTDFHGIARSSSPQMGALGTDDFIWQGSLSTDFADAANWAEGAVPTDGADIFFAANPDRNCILDQNRVIGNITNAQGTNKLMVNSFQLTLTGDLIFTNGAQIDATAASSELVFAGTSAQSIPSGAFVSNTVISLSINNINGLTLGGDLSVSGTLSLTNGAFSLGANTLALDGAIAITAGTLIGGSSSNISINGSGASTALPPVMLHNLTLNRANGIGLGGAVSIAGTLNLTDGTLTLGANTLTISGISPIRTSGNIDAGDVGATLAFTNTAAIILPASIFTGNVNNIIINGTGGISAGSDFTVNGVLNLQSANPSATTGSLNLGAYTLTMGANATTDGNGDVTGIVRREHTFVTNTIYSFGSKYTTFKFVDDDLKPTWISCKISIGAIPAWSSWTPNGKVARYYNVAVSDNNSTSRADISMRYLLSELDPTYNEESKLVFWHEYVNYAGGAPHEHGKSVQDFLNHSIGVTGLIFGLAASTNLDESEVAIAYSETLKNTWKGEVIGHETEWDQSQNWTAGHVPLSTDDVLIPSGLPYYPSLTASANALAMTLEIDFGASISANSYEMLISGANGAWINNGTLNAGTGKVIFNHGVSTEIVTVAGITNFYNVEIGANTTIEPVSGCIFRIAGSATGNPPTSKANWAVVNSTVEWNGTDQNINNPIALNGSSGYYNLILSGSGTKTMPATPLNIIHDFFLTGTATATAASAITVGGELEIQAGAAFATGNYDHTVGENFDNSGTFTASSGTTITLYGTSAQAIYGETPTNFEKLVVNNPAGVNIATNTTVNDMLILTSGILSTGDITLTINGAISQSAGFIEMSTPSSLSFGGTTAITLPSTLFTSTPSINNLTINRTGGVTFSSDFTVNGVLNLQSVNPTAIKGSLDMWDGSADKVLTMGASATTIGTGDVTGIITRNTMVPNVTYTFGNQFSSIIFPEVGTLPTSLSVKVSIGSAPSWKPGAVQRTYAAIQTGGSGTLALIKMHYLDSELNGNTEDNIVEWIYVYSGSVLLEQGRASFNENDNWIAMANVNIALFSSDFSDLEIGMGESELASITWNGSVNTDWFETGNWTPTGAPSDNTIVIIPDAATTSNDPDLPVVGTCGTFELESGAIVNSSTDAQLTINGASSAWSNEDGTFNAGNSTVIFTNPDATVDGTTNFYNLTLNSGAAIILSTGSVTKIAGALSNNGILRAAFLPNTIEYNGTDQTIINPNGLTTGYYNLILSGSGTKIMPSDGLNIIGDFSMAGSATTTAASNLAIGGDFTLGTGTTFTTGSLDHLLGGNFTNNGIFIASVGDTIEFIGTGVQYIDGSSSTTFYILDLDEVSGVTMATDITVDYLLEMDNGDLRVEDNTLGINGSITANGGFINLTTQSSLAFGGTASITVTSSMFSGPPVINNLTINRSGGVTFSFDLTVNGVLNLQSVNPSSSKGTLDMLYGSLIQTLSMGASATTIGDGEVTGIIGRTSFLANIPYTFGNKLNTVTFDPGGTYPTEVKAKISIGTSPSWKTNGMLRVFELIQTGSDNCSVNVTMHYLDSELNGNTEDKLVFWANLNSVVTDFGRSGGYDVTDNWVSNAHVPFFIFASSFGITENTLGDTEQEIITWNGSISNVWATDNNWDPVGVPSSTSDVIIPDAGTTDNDPTLPASTEIKTLTINTGGIVNAGTDSQFTLNGAFKVWDNQGGTFNAGNSTILITNPFAVIFGGTSFNNLTINTGASLEFEMGSTTSISGSLINNGTINAELLQSTLEYNGTDQTVINPNGTIPGYQNLILSGSGVKTMPGAAMSIYGDFSMSGTASATANDNLTFEGNVTIGASTNFTTGSFAHSIDGNFENNGSFNAVGSTITLNGKAAQTIGGTAPVDFNNLTISSGSIITVNTAGQTIGGILLSNGTLNSGGNITLLSTAAQTAFIDGSGSGQVNGNITMQRYLPSGFGYKYFSSPFLAATVNEFGDDMDLAVTFPTIYRYDESRVSSGWVSYITTTNVLNPLEGYTVNFGSGTAANTVDVTGVVNNGSLLATLFNNNNTYTKGFNLVGNPYPSAIDWDASSGWTKTNIDDALYYFAASITDQYRGTYSTYINSVSSDGSATNIIPSMQGFFVHVTDGAWPVTGILALDNDVRITDMTHPFLKSTKQNVGFLLRLIAGYSEDTTVYDPVVVYFNDNATSKFDGQFDALKLFNSDRNVPNLYTNSNDSARLSINALPNTSDSLIIVSLGLKTAKDGNVFFKIKDLEGFSTGKAIYLFDTLTKTKQDLLSNGVYKLYLLAGDYKNRFYLNFLNDTTVFPDNPPDTIDNPSDTIDYPTDTVTFLDTHLNADWFTIYDSHGILKSEINFPSGENGTLTIYDLTGQVAFVQKIYKPGHYEFRCGLIAGIYIARFNTGSKRSIKKLFIRQP